MKRLFITTNVEKASDMYNRTGHEARKTKVDTDFAEINTSDKQYQYNEELTVLVLPDTFTDWQKYDIKKEEDYILYHQEQRVRPTNTTLNLFKSNKGSSHILGNPHDKVYRIIFDDTKRDTDKAKEILEVIAFDHEEERLTEAIFTAIYDKKQEEEIEAAIKARDNYVNSKLNKN